MKEAKNNEVDLLLRSLAQSRGESPLQRSDHDSFSEHLDADELNSYAEGVAPAAARSRYTEHLADCAGCRRVVIGLTQAAGRATRYETPDQQTAVNFWQKLALVFSPAVLRYAVPALVLAGVIGIGLVALRQKPQSEFIAQDRRIESGPPLAQSNQTPAPGPNSATTAKNFDSQTDLETKKNNDLQNEKSQIAQAPANAPDSNVAIAPLDKDATKTGQAAGGSELYALEPKPPAPPPASVTPSEADKPAGFIKEQPAKREEQDRQRAEFGVQSSDEHGPNRSAAPRPSTATLARGRDDGLRAGGPSSDKKTKTNEVESSTTVAGRHFRRDGNTWVDTDYESPRATINLRRGSEQFRALVGDEPGLRTIADQLSGVVYVVWKNRAYRIQ